MGEEIQAAEARASALAAAAKSIWTRVVALFVEGESKVKMLWARSWATFESAHNVVLAAVAAVEAWFQGLQSAFKADPLNAVKHFGVTWQFAAVVGSVIVLLELAKVLHK